MRKSIIIALLSVCQQTFCENTKCQISLVSPPLRSLSQREQGQAQRIKFQKQVNELFYTIDSLNLDDSIVMILWTTQSYYLLDLVQYTETQLLQLQGISKKDVIKIREKLLTKSLHLDMHLPHEIIQEGIQKSFKEKLSLYMKFMENVYSIPIDIPRNTFIEKLILEVEKLNNSRLYHPVKIEGHYNVKGAFKNISLYNSTKLPDNNLDIRREALRQISFIMMQNQIKYKDHEI